MERNDNQQHPEPDCITAGPQVASGDSEATVEQLRRQLWEQMMELDDDRIRAAGAWMLHIRRMDLASRFDDSGLGVFDGE